MSSAALGEEQVGLGAFAGARTIVNVGGRAVTLVFALALMLSSLLMFLVEPMVAKMLLPAFGGAPMVWNTCVLFFQVVLLGGYAFANAAAHVLDARRRSLAFAALVAASWFALPITISAPAGSAVESPVLSLFVILAAAIGIPFFVLSTCASTLQKLFSETDHPAAHDPYFLYVASNLGSLVALIAYPTIVEPYLPLSRQREGWTVAYALLAVLAAAVTALTWRRRRGATENRAAAMPAPRTVAAPVPLPRRLYWMALSFAPSSLMLSVTTYLSTDIASVPLMWIVPLGLYLLTFVLVFSAHGGTWGRVGERTFPWLVLPVAVLMAVGLSMPPAVGFPLHLTTFFAAALLCHGKLAVDRPDASRVTTFYFWVALGGVIAGLFNTLLAPMMFDSIAEYGLILVLACTARVRPHPLRSPEYGLMGIVVPVVMSTVTTVAVATVADVKHPGMLIAAFALPMLVYFISFKRPLLFAATLGGLLLAGSFLPDQSGRVRYTQRTFFGVYRVVDDPDGRHRSLISGSTLHGRQALDSSRRAEPLTYYHRTGPIGQAFTSLESMADARHVAVVGLGIGSLASYARPGQRWTFFEIDPAVERIARSPFFSHLRSCSACDVRLGDARLSLESSSETFGAIVLDAFSSDAIPVHLMTSEALALYLRHLSPEGVLAFHISNRHLALGPVVARLARQYGLVAIEQRERIPDDHLTGKTASHWVLMSRDARHLAPLIGDSRWSQPTATGTRLWTDEFSDILGVLAIRGER